MRTRFFALILASAGLAACATDYVPPRPSSELGPAYNREIEEGRPGLFGDLRWNIDLSGRRAAAERAAAHDTASPTNAAEQEEFKKWRESAGRSERQEFDDWRAWQEWKRQNPK